MNMIPCPNCRGRNTRTNNKAVTLWPSPQVSRLKFCFDCKCVFETIESCGKIVKDHLPSQKRQYKFSNEMNMSKTLRQMEVGDYMILPNDRGRKAFTQTMNKIYGTGCHRTRRITNTNNYHCMRIK